MATNQLTVAHVTHEASEKIGGIGTVLEGILTSPSYLDRVSRSIIVGPLFERQEVGTPAQSRLGADGEVLFSSIDDLDRSGLKHRLQPIIRVFNTPMVYGRRTYRLTGQDGRSAEHEVLLIDVFNINQDRLNVFKHRLSEKFGLESHRYEHMWEFEEYVRLAEPCFCALSALLDEPEQPLFLFAHEFMGLPAALKAAMDGNSQMRTIFHGHECAPARRLVESLPGHDIAFYNILDRAREQGLYMVDVFGPQDDNFKYELVTRAHLCDAVIAVGPRAADEIHFLDRRFDHHHIDLVYNGLPNSPVSVEDREKARNRLADYAERLVGPQGGFRPDFLLTHVTRPVISKGIWRDVAVCHQLDRLFEGDGKRAVLFILTTAGGRRRPRDIAVMEEEYGWPRNHRQGYPDLVGMEIEINAMVDTFNEHHENVQIVLVNQFGWSADLIGKRLPPEMTMTDLRRATDVEFGMATYEPFGISPLEPLAAGAICVISDVCGCRGFVESVANGGAVENVLVARFSGALQFADAERSGASSGKTMRNVHGRNDWTIDGLLSMTREQRDRYEQPVVAHVADEIFARLPKNDADRKRLLESGGRLASQLGWDGVIDRALLPLFDRVVSSP